MRRVSLIFIRNKERFLCYLRDNKQTIPHPNYWAFIGGGNEKGETPLQALKREISEELKSRRKGEIVTDIRYLDVIKVRKNPEVYDHDIYTYKGRTNHRLEELTLTEGQRLGYFTFDEIMNEKFPEFLKIYIKKNLSRLD